MIYYGTKAQTSSVTVWCRRCPRLPGQSISLTLCIRSSLSKQLPFPLTFSAQWCSDNGLKLLPIDIISWCWCGNVLSSLVWGQSFGDSHVLRNICLWGVRMEKWLSMICLFVRCSAVLHGYVLSEVLDLDHAVAAQMYGEWGRWWWWCWSGFRGAT